MSRSPQVAVVVIGAEVLSGKVRDENGPFLIDSLRSLGATLVELRVIDDDTDTIAETVRALAARFDYVITTGGIGPTHDDLTVAGIARAFEVAVVRDSGLVEDLRGYYHERLTDQHLRLADVPEGSKLHRDLRGVPVLQMRNVFVLPGIPALARRCFEQVADVFQGDAVVTRVLFVNAAETDIAETLNVITESHPEVRIGSYPRTDDPRARVKVTVESTERAEVRRAVDALRERLPDGMIVDEQEGDRL
ncbi:MAG: molybdopterin-binding protein [Myxococcota bacterium]